jgi:hypothetical protein
MLRRFVLGAGVAFALLIPASAAYAQQPAAPRFTTCSQQLPFCESGCASVYKQAYCRANCRQYHADCMATGFWINPNTGQKSPRQRQ